jgi:hypothetical protein
VSILVDIIYKAIPEWHKRNPRPGGWKPGAAPLTPRATKSKVTLIIATLRATRVRPDTRLQGSKKTARSSAKGLSYGARVDVFTVVTTIASLAISAATLWVTWRAGRTAGRHKRTPRRR